jgi:hypothetical protein
VSQRLSDPFVSDGDEAQENPPRRTKNASYRDPATVSRRKRLMIEEDDDVSSGTNSDKDGDSDNAEEEDNDDGAGDLRALDEDALASAIAFEVF